MELKKVALIAEVAGGIAILITLIILTVEIRSNSQLIERQLILDRVNADAQVVDSPYLAPIIVKIKSITKDMPPTHIEIMKRYDLSPEDAFRFFAYIQRDWTVLEADFNFGSSGVEKRAKDLLRSEDIRLVWMMEFSDQKTEFAEFVNDLIE